MALNKVEICGVNTVITHLPGVLFQQAKHPLQGAIFFSERFICLISASLSISKMPSRNALESFNVLLRSPFGLPLIKRIFIPISISQALCAEGTARQTSSSSLRSWLLCVACNAVSLMFSIAHPNIRCIVILVKSVVFRPLYSAVLRHIYHNHIRSDLFDILIRNRILRIAAKQAFPVFAADARHNDFLDHAAALIELKVRHMSHFSAVA